MPMIIRLFLDDDYGLQAHFGALIDNKEFAEIFPQLNNDFRHRISVG